MPHPRSRSSASPSRSRPSSRARETPTAAPRALNEPVGSRPSSLIISRGRPIRSPRRGAGEQRRHALAQRDHVLGRGHRQQLVVAPQVRRPRGDLGRPDRHRWPGRTWPAAVRRTTVHSPWQHGRVVRRAAARALQVAQRRSTDPSVHPGRARVRAVADRSAAARRLGAARRPRALAGFRTTVHAVARLLVASAVAVTPPADPVRRPAHRGRRARRSAARAAAERLDPLDRARTDRPARGRRAAVHPVRTRRLGQR